MAMGRASQGGVGGQSNQSFRIIKIIKIKKGFLGVGPRHKLSWVSQMVVRDNRCHNTGRSTKGQGL